MNLWAFCENARCVHVFVTLITLHIIFHVCFNHTFLNTTFIGTLWFFECIPPIEYSYDRLHPFTFVLNTKNSKHHNTNMITFSLSLHAYDDEPLVPSPFHSFGIITSSLVRYYPPRVCRPTLIHPHHVTVPYTLLVTVHRIYSIPSIFYSGVLVTIYSIYILPYTIYRI